jgi:hypothetical protein
MRVFNKLGHTCYFPYAGISRRGVNLKSQEQSPDLPVERVNHPGLRSDLKRGRIGVMLSPTDKSALRSMVDSELMAMLEGSKKPEKASVPETLPGRQMDARPPQSAEPITEKADASYEAVAAPRKVDAVKEELVAKTAMMTEEGKKETLDKLAESSQPSLANAAAELKSESSEDAQSRDNDDTAGDDSSGEPAADVEPSGEGTDQTVAEHSGVKTYRGIAKPKLLSEALSRNLSATPDMKVKELRELFIADDLKKVQG